MADVVDNEKGSVRAGSSDAASQEVFERPPGLKGLYYHPLTQVNQQQNWTPSNIDTGHHRICSLRWLISVCCLIRDESENSTSYSAMNIHTSAKGFVIAAGAILGICAGLLWTAQGSLMMAYPTEADKGKYIAVFWSIFNLGGVVGASVALGENFHSTIAFLVLTCLGVLIPFFMVDPAKMIRTDGTRVTPVRHPSWKSEFHGLFVALRTDPMIFLLFPMFLASNWFYTWQFNDYNGAIFNIRARALNNVVYWTAQIIGSVAISALLDSKLKRRVRAFLSWGVLFIFVFFVHIWAYFYQKTYTRASVPPDSQRLDIYSDGYTGKIFLYIFCGILDAMWQTTAYWLMGAMSNNPAKLAIFAGFYKSLQSAGAAGMWRADAVKTPYMNIFASTWALLIAGLLFVLPMIHLRVTEHTDGENDTMYAFSNTTRFTWTKRIHSDDDKATQ
ncbi:hypothetical protein H0H93_008194 [Arthromyces matolae]|nr:hypothetical protein H0H93_008194 [Arthromyces matolae]